MKLYYVANARMPNEKAHGIQIAKTCESFIHEGVDVTLVVPGRAKEGSVQDFYALSTPVPLVRIPVLNFYNSGRVGFFVSSVSFILGYLFFLITRRLRGERFGIYSVDMDSFSHIFLRLAGVPYFCEMHGVKKMSRLTRYFFAKVTGIIAINSLIKQSFVETFAVSPQRILVEPNGVDLALFARDLSKAEAREQLHLPSAKPIALYVGRGYSWKGLNILAEAAEQCQDVLWYVVGSTRAELESWGGVAKVPDNMVCVGERPYVEIPSWLRAADVVLVLGTKQNDSSYRYTSPMKLFEYMAAKTPIVASRTPAVEEVLRPEDTFFYEPDDTMALIEAVKEALSGGQGGEAHAFAAFERVQTYTWKMRAVRILAFLTDLMDNTSRKN